MDAAGSPPEWRRCSTARAPSSRAEGGAHAEGAAAQAGIAWVVSVVTQLLKSGASLRNAWLLEEVQELADTDSLTRIANRRIFEAALEREVNRATRRGERVSLVMLDIDHFKRLNDDHGHQVGDEVLRQVATIVASQCRQRPRSTSHDTTGMLS